MKAIVFNSYGGPEVLELKELEPPVPAAKEVLVKVHAVSLNDWDWGILQSSTFLDRLMNSMAKPTRNILGSDIAGTVESVGDNVTGLKPGDHVYGDLSGRWGGLAEYVSAPEKSLALKPLSMSFVDAASIPQAGMLAVQGLIDKGHLQSGQQLLINGAGGGVGTFGIQIAKLYGVEITAVDHASKLDMLRSLGADHVIDYTKEDFTKNGHQYDLVLDTKTNRHPLRYLKSLKPGGQYITVGGSITKLFQTLLTSPWVSLLTSKKLGIVMLKANKDLPYFNDLFNAGKIKPVIDPHIYSLEDVPEAFQLFSRAEHKGKIVISLD